MYDVVLGQGHGEEELVVFAAVEGAGGDVHVELFGGYCGLVVEGYAFFVDAAAAVAGFADVLELAAESVGDVYHRGGDDACLTQSLYDVVSGFGLHLAFEEVFFACKFGLGYGVDELVGGAACALCLFVGFFDLLVVDGFLAFEYLESHVGCAEVA